MDAVLDKLRLYEWNKRPFTEDDFYRFCEQEEIIVFCGTRGWPGEYFIHRGHPVILLHPDLQGYTRLWVAFHELAHHWLHAIDSHFFYGTTNKVDLQADRIATPAIIPTDWLKEPGLFDLFEQGYPPALLETRIKIYEQFKL